MVGNWSKQSMDCKLYNNIMKVYFWLQDFWVKKLELEPISCIGASVITKLSIIYRYSCSLLSLEMKWMNSILERLSNLSNLCHINIWKTCNIREYMKLQKTPGISLLFFYFIYCVPNLFLSIGDI